MDPVYRSESWGRGGGGGGERIRQVHKHLHALILPVSSHNNKTNNIILNQGLEVLWLVLAREVHRTGEDGGCTFYNNILRT